MLAVDETGIILIAIPAGVAVAVISVIWYILRGKRDPPS